MRKIHNYEYNNISHYLLEKKMTEYKSNFKPK